MQQHFFNVRVKDGKAVWKVVTAILRSEGVKIPLLVSDFHQRQFVDERKVAVFEAMVNVDFSDVLCDGVSVENIGAVKIVKCADL